MNAPWTRVLWRRLDAPFASEPGPRRLDGVLPTATGFLGYGRAWQRGRNQFDEMGAVFLSDDGVRWWTVLVEDGVGAGDTSEISLAVAGPRGIVLFGNTCCGKEERAAWHSLDGTAWKRLPVSSSMEFPSAMDLTTQLSAATGLSDGFVVVGVTGDRAAIWTSTDGLSWRSVATSAAGLGSGQVTSVARVGSGWLAAGWQDDGETYDGALWESEDGFEWRPVPTPELFTGPLDTALGRLLPTEAGVLLMGQEGPHEERVRCEKLLGRTASLGPPSPPDRTALSCGWGRETHWWSADGRRWERLPPVAPAPGDPALPAGSLLEYRLVVPGGPGLVNLGEQSGGGARTWISADGRAWERLDDIDPLRPSLDMASGIVADGRRLIVVGDAWEGGSQPGLATIWIGTVE